VRRRAGIGVVSAGLLVAALSLGLSAFASGGTGGGSTFQAEFQDARGLVEGNDVRVDGAPAGSVEDMKLTDHGTALVTMKLDDGIPRPTADASAAIRPVDLLGDTYMALEPGDAQTPLQGPIPTSRTLNAPRLDDLLRTFGEPQRDALRILLVEGGVALDRRGADLNKAALELSPALRAADGAMRELGSQNADLRSFVSNAEHVTSQAADRNGNLGSLVESLDATLSATASSSGDLDRSLAGLPPTLTQIQSTTGRLTSTARAALPLAQSLERTAPGLSRAAEQLGPFLGSTREAADQLHPTISRASDLLAENAGTFAALRTGLGQATADSPTFQRFMDAVKPAAPAISAGFFKNFPDQATEPGNQPFDPFADPRRHYWRGAAVLTCQTFGLRIHPGCLADFLKSGAASSSGFDLNSPKNDSSGAGSGTSQLPLPSLGQVQKALPDLSHPNLPSPPSGPAPSSGGAGSLLNFLLGR
jgi:phospholipid/cholesterol/gamma-HCH transport system substrate-binding protein